MSSQAWIMRGEYCNKCDHEIVVVRSKDEDSDYICYCSNHKCKNHKKIEKLHESYIKCSFSKSKDLRY